MSDYGLIYRTTMCCTLDFTASKFVAISIFMNLKEKDCILLARLCFSLQEKQFPTITPPKQMQTLLFYRL